MMASIATLIMMVAISATSMLKIRLGSNAMHYFSRLSCALEPMLATVQG